MADNDSREPWNELESSGFSALIGRVYHRLQADGRMLFRLEPDERHGNRSGSVHGGVIMTFADIAFANTLRHADPARGYLTVQLDAHFFRPASLAAPLYCECSIQKNGQRLAFVQASFQSNDRLVANVLSIWSIPGLKQDALNR